MYPKVSFDIHKDYRAIFPVQDAVYKKIYVKNNLAQNLD